VAVPGVLSNDTDIDGDPLTAVLVIGPSNGTLTLNADASFSYIPNADFNGTDSFTYKANDGTADSNTATVTITVDPVNDAPVAVGDSYSVDEDNTLIVAAPGVLGNDGDPDNDPLAAVLVSGPSNGTLTLNGDGSFTYTPDTNLNGTDSFSYKANDGTVDSNTVMVSITVNPVNDRPVAVDDSATTDEDTAVTIEVLANDSDPDGDSLTVNGVTQGENGTVTSNPDGSVTYTPNPDFTGTDSFNYTISDGKSGTDTAIVTVIVTSVNDAPVVADDSYSTSEDVPLTVAAPGVLGDDTDADGDSLTAVLVSGPSNGTLTLNGDGSFSYIPNADFNGTDSFTYKANDGTADSNTATVTITVNPVNDAPVAVGDSYSVDEDNTLTVAAPGVLGNDTDADGDSLTAVLVSGPSNGTLTLNADGSFSYILNADFNGTDSFTYKANDGTADSNVVTVTITVQTPIQAIEDLIKTVKSLGLHHGIENSLVKKLEGAIKALERGNDEAAIGKLNAFIKEVGAQRGKKIAEEDAIYLTEAAETIIAAIEKSAAPPVLARGIPVEITLAPRSFALHQNYPNPFNPDTWIPYQLKEDANTIISIYSSTGQLIRRLNLGNKKAGYYTSRDRAVYWDGRNGYGEKVSSGVYFYTIQAGDFVATRKMLIAK